MGCIPQNFDNPFGGFLIEVAGGLISQNDRCGGNQGSANGHPLLLTTRQRKHVPLRSGGINAQPGEVVNAGLGVDQAQVLQRSQIVDEVVVLEHQRNLVFAVTGVPGFGNIIAAKPDGPLTGCIESRQQVQHGGLARTGRTDDRVERALFEVIGDVAQHPLGRIGIAEIDVIKLHDGHDVS